jgi:hypothetical protein
MVLHAARIFAGLGDHAEDRVRVIAIENHVLQNFAAIVTHLGNGFIVEASEYSQYRLPTELIGTILRGRIIDLQDSKDTIRSFQVPGHPVK